MGEGDREGMIKIGTRIFGFRMWRLDGAVVVLVMGGMEWVVKGREVWWRRTGRGGL